ncbi:MAG: ribosome maturation factor RimM [Hahellaceae bacterium]|nr:ribosome maturation factor RimM [Hahellaceae bacterium]
MSDAKADSLAVLGKITSVYGIKGWVKVLSYTEPHSNILKYRHWTLDLNGRKFTLELLEGKPHGKGLVARLSGCSDRDQAAGLCGALISVDANLLPALEEGEYYWHQLEGLTVRLTDGRELGTVSYLLETGSNDVLVVKGTASSIDKKERLVPYLPGQFVQQVDLENRQIVVDWDPEF